MKKYKYLYYTLLSVVVLALLGYLLSTAHTPFNWQPSLSTKSKEPFGTILFDQLMQKSLPLGYDVEDDFPDSLNVNGNAILYSKATIGGWVDNYSYSTENQEIARARKLFSFAKNGGKVIVATSKFDVYSDSLAKTYGIPRFRYQYASIYNDIVEEVEKQKKMPVAPVRLSIMPERRNVYVNKLLITGHGLDSCYSKAIHEGIILDENGHPIAFTRRFKSGGEICYVSAPLLFSNYAAADPQARVLIQTLMTRVADRHVVRILGKNHPEKHSIISNDAFQFLHNHPSLNMAINLFAWVLVLALLFLSRRRMRAIPLPEKEHNMTLDFAKTMGTFHYRHRNWKILLQSDEEKQEKANRQELAETKQEQTKNNR